MNSPWDNTFDRILNGPLNRYLYLGDTLNSGVPVLPPRKRSNPHTWVMGAPGTGKTGRYLAPVTTQMMANEDRTIVIVDFKPDLALLLNARSECARAGLPFRVLDPTPGHWSHLFNPLTQSHLERQNPSAKIETLMQALALEFGSDYGRGHYSAQNEAASANMFGKYPDSTFERLAMLLLDPAAFAFMERDQWKDSSQLRVQMAKAAAVPWLSAGAETPCVTAEMLANAVDVRQLFHQVQCVYLALNSAELRTTSRLIMGLFAYSLFSAAAREKRKCDVELIMDEGQEFAGSSLAAILDRARSSGIGITFVHQHLEQLKRSDQDYAEALEAGTGLHVVFNPTSYRTRKWILDTCGTVLSPSVTWQQILSGYEQHEDFNLKYASSGIHGERPRASVTEKEVRRISENDLIRWSSRPEIALVRLLHDEQGTKMGGQWIPTVMPFHIGRKDYEERTAADFPELPGQMFVPIESEWDRRFQSPRPNAAKEQLAETIKKLRARKK